MHNEIPGKDNMKKAEDCKDISEIRDCIDEIDKNIIDCFALRSDYVKCAARYKKTIAEVKASDRVSAMITVRRSWATEKGIDPNFTQFLFENIVDYFIANEKREWVERKGNEGSAISDVTINDATIEDARIMLSLQKRAFIQEVELNDNNFNIPPMQQSHEEILKDFTSCVVLKAIKNELLIGSVRAKQVNSTCHIGRLIVEPIFQKQGIGRILLQSIENRFTNVIDYELFTGVNSTRSRKFYRYAGYVEEEEYDAPDGTRLVKLRKKNVKKDTVTVVQ